jgi:hypothetical protein
LETTPEPTAQSARALGDPGDLAVFEGETGDETVSLTQWAIAQDETPGA